VAEGIGQDERVPIPSISICIPVHNGAPWIDDAIDSALAQTRGDFELLLVENASTDGTGEIVRRRSADDPRIRTECFDELVGAAANHNRAIRLARGELIKFLHADDVLYPHCVERMARIFDEHPEVGLVFAPRDILLEDAYDGDSRDWVDRYGTLHQNFAGLVELNRGSDLLRQYLPTFVGAGYQNWVGEPSAVMVRRACFERTAAFRERLRVIGDVELWLRLFALADVGFVDEPLSAFRHHGRSATASHAQQRADWLDLLWLYEGLLAEPALEQYHPLVRQLRRSQTRTVVRKQLGRLGRGNLSLRPLAAYIRHRISDR
jgi:glycosyltransferase involved in cell wall biosynthesis